MGVRGVLISVTLNVFTPRPARALAAAIVLSVAGCLSTPPLGPQFSNPAGGRQVLFIGNSLTAYNDLPVLVQALADAAGGDSIAIAMHTPGNTALIDHWKAGVARQAIESQPWDFVVLQQGPSSVAANRDTLRLATGLFAPVIEQAGAKVVMFSAWPTIDRQQDFTRAAESYRLAAADVGGIYAPIATAWAMAMSRDATVRLYAGDGLHPSFTGSYLAALVLYSKILGKSPVGLPASFPVRGGGVVAIPAALNTMLQEVAWEAVSASNASEAARRR